jgi:hypothetical protein
MTLTTAFVLAVLSGTFWGMFIGWVREGREVEKADFEGAALIWAGVGALSAAIIFGLQVAVAAMFYFLFGPQSPADMLRLTLFVLLLFGLPCLLF